MAKKEREKVLKYTFGNDNMDEALVDIYGGQMEEFLFYYAASTSVGYRDLFTMFFSDPALYTKNGLKKRFKLGVTPTQRMLIVDDKYENGFVSKTVDDIEVNTRLGKAIVTDGAVISVPEALAAIRGEEAKPYMYSKPLVMQMIDTDGIEHLNIIKFSTISLPEKEVKKFAGTSDIDFVEFESAVKNGLTVKDKNGGRVTRGTNQDTYRIISTEPEKHVDKKISMGVQAFYMLQHNIDLSLTYNVANVGEITGDKLMDLFERTVKEKISREYNKIIKNTGTNEIDSSIRNKKIYNFLKNKLSSSMYGLSILESLKLVNTDSGIVPNIPYDFDGMSDIVEGNLMAPFKNLLKINMRGAMLKQFPSVFVDGSLKDPYVDKDGNVQPGEIVIPFPYVRQLERLKTEEAKSDFIHNTLNNILVLTRTPTPIESFIGTFKVKMYIPTESDSVVFVPPAVYKMMHSDNDGDSVHAFMPEVDKKGNAIVPGHVYEDEDNEGVYFTENVESSSDIDSNLPAKSLNNLLLNIFISIINNKSLINKFHTDGDYKGLKNMATTLNDVQGISEDDIGDFFSPVGQFNMSVVFGGSNIGRGALSKRHFDMVGKYPAGYVEFVSDDVIYKEYKTNDVTDSGDLVTRHLGDITNAAVDHVNTPISYFLSLNKHSHAVDSVLIRKGVDLHTRYFYLSTPVLKRIYKDADLYGLWNSIKRALNNTLSELKRYDIDPDSINTDIMSLVNFEKLVEPGAKADLSITEQAKLEYLIVKYFADLVEEGDELTKSIMVLRYDTFISDMSYPLIDAIYKTFEKEANNKLYPMNVFFSENSMNPTKRHIYNLAILKSKDVVNDMIYASKAFKDVNDWISSSDDEIEKQRKLEDEVSIRKYVTSFLRSLYRFKESKYFQEVAKRFEHTNEYTSKIYDELSKLRSSNPTSFFLNRIAITTDKTEESNNKTLRFIYFNESIPTPDAIKVDIKQELKVLYLNSNTKKIMTDLFDYMFMMYGGMNSKKNIPTSMIPVEYFIDNNVFEDFRNNKDKTSDLNYFDFSDRALLLLNRRTHYKFPPETITNEDIIDSKVHGNLVTSFLTRDFSGLIVNFGSYTYLWYGKNTGGSYVYNLYQRYGTKSHAEFSYGESGFSKENAIDFVSENGESRDVSKMFTINALRTDARIFFQVNEMTGLEQTTNLTESIIPDIVNAENVANLVEEKPNVENTKITGINVRPKKSSINSLANRLTNPNWYSVGLMDVESVYKANASKIKAPQLDAEEALKYDMNLMYKLQVEKFRKNPELIDEINERGGLEFIMKSSHIVGVKNSRWEGIGMESNFIKVLAKSYEIVAKELNKFINIETSEEQISESDKNIISTTPNIIKFEEEQSSGYRERTIKNASADVTLALAFGLTSDMLKKSKSELYNLRNQRPNDLSIPSAGEKLTFDSVVEQNKKYVPIDAANLKITQERVDKIVNVLNSIKYDLFGSITLNIAGNGIYTMKGKYTQQQIDDFTYNLLKAIIESPNLKVKIESIRTGGQTGFDEAGAKAGIKLEIPTLILAPKDWKFRDVNKKDISDEKQFKDRFNIPTTPTKPREEQVVTNVLTTPTKPTDEEITKAVIYQGNFTRQDIKNRVDLVMLFGDNIEDSITEYIPTATQAVIRGLPNAVGIPTKKNRGTKDSSYFTDNDFEEFVKLVNKAINKAIKIAKENDAKIAIPSSGIGTGKAQLEERAPKLFRYLQARVNRLFTNTAASDEEINELKEFCRTGGKGKPSGGSNLPKAEYGLKTNTINLGNNWQLVKDIKGPSHKHGGVDINISNNGIKVSDKDGNIEAGEGLVIPINN